MLFGRTDPRDMSSMGATFYPGNDDYMMPELNIESPAPQRFVPSLSCVWFDSIRQFVCHFCCCPPNPSGLLSYSHRQPAC